MPSSSGRLRSVLAHLHQHQALQRCSGDAAQPRGSDGGAAEQVLSAATLDLRDAVARLHRFGFCVISGVLDAEETRVVNAWVDSSLERTPTTWGRISSGGLEGDRAEYMQPLLDEHGAELDRFFRLPRLFPLIDELLGGEACFTQLDFRQSPGGLELRNDLHHDVGSAGTSTPEAIAARPPDHHDTLCSIIYLTSVDETTPAFAVVPGSHRVPVWPRRGAAQRSAEEDAAMYDEAMATGGVGLWRTDSEEEQVRAALGDELREVRLEAPAGSAVVYDVSLFHGRSAGRDPSTTRRTLHHYYGRHSNPPNIPWALLPQRLAEHPDPEIRRYCSNLTPVQEAFAESGYDMAALSRSPRLREHLTENGTARRYSVKGEDELGLRFLAAHGPAHQLPPLPDS